MLKDGDGVVNVFLIELRSGAAMKETPVLGRRMSRIESRMVAKAVLLLPLPVMLGLGELLSMDGRAERES